MLTRQQVYKVLHQALALAVEDELIARNPVHKKDKPKHYLVFYLALATGMRQGEIFGLRWDSVDFDNASVYVRATLTKDKEGNPTLSPPKASRKRRIDLSHNLVGLLKEHKKKQRPLGPWVFADINGEPLQKDRFVRMVFHPLLKQTGIGHMRFQDLRHTMATLALSHGDNVKVIQERLGHSSAKMTLDVYAKAVPTLQREAATKMDAILAVNGETCGETREVKGA